MRVFDELTSEAVKILSITGRHDIRSHRVSGRRICYSLPLYVCYDEYRSCSMMNKEEEEEGKIWKMVRVRVKKGGSEERRCVKNRSKRVKKRSSFTAYLIKAK